MDLSFRHDLWLRRLPASPRDTGRVERIVVRTGPGQRATPDSALFSVERGLEGDSWLADGHARPGNQVSLINVRLLRLIAGGEERMALSGDNLQVDLDLCEENLPVGSLLTIGEAVLEVTPDPHRPCRRFVERFGALNTKRIARGNRIGLRSRGVLARVVQAGLVRTGAAIHVRRPGTACLS